MAPTVRIIALPGQVLSGHIIEIGAEGEFALNRDVKRGRPDVRTFRVRVAFDEIPTPAAAGHDRRGACSRRGRRHRSREASR